MKVKALALPISLGGNFLNIKKYIDFLEQSKHLFSDADYKMLKDGADRCLKGTVLREVVVKKVHDNSLAECHFSWRGGHIEVLYAPAECLRPIRYIEGSDCRLPQNSNSSNLTQCNA